MLLYRTCQCFKFDRNLSVRQRPRSVLKVRQPHFDGAGAQILRVITTYAIAKHWDLDFSFNQLASIDTQAFAHQDESILWNTFLLQLLPNNPCKLENYTKEVIHKNHRPWLLRKKIQVGDFFKGGRLHVIDSPQVIINKFPEILLHLDFKHQIAVHKKLRKQNTLRVVVHIRQGELAFSQYEERRLDLAYFEGILSLITPILDNRQIPYEILVCSEPNQDTLIPANDPRVIESLRLDPRNRNVLRIDNAFFKVVHENPSFDKTPILKKSNWIHNQSAYSDFLEFLNADILLISKSSFSYLGGLLNSDALVITPEFWLPPLPSWVSMKDKPRLKSQLRTKLNSISIE